METNQLVDFYKNILVCPVRLINVSISKTKFWTKRYLVFSNKTFSVVDDHSGEKYLVILNYPRYWDIGVYPRTVLVLYLISPCIKKSRKVRIPFLSLSIWVLGLETFESYYFLRIVSILDKYYAWWIYTKLCYFYILASC